MPKPPKELIEGALDEIGARVNLTEGASPDSHTAVIATGLDDPVVAQSLATYAVAFLAGWVERTATISERLGVRGVERRDEIRRLVAKIVSPPEGLNDDQTANWRDTWRNAWIAEVLTHALLVVRRSVASDSLKGDVVALLRPHPLPKRQGLDTVAIYDEANTAVLVVGETKASCEHGGDELTKACSMFESVELGMHGPDLRDAIDSLGAVIPDPLASQVSEALWRDECCFVPSVVHERPFDSSLSRNRLLNLGPTAERKRVLVLRVADFHTFFDAVAGSMPSAVDEVVV